jgi:hypothetical protein
MSANTQKNNKHKSAQFPFWKTKKFKNKKKKKKPQTLSIVKDAFIPDDEDKAIAQGILLNDKRLSFLARSGCNELVRNLINNPHVSSPDRLAVMEHLAKASPKIFPLVEKMSLIKYAYEVHFFEKYEKNQVKDILAKLQLAQTRSASSLLEARLKAFKLGGDFFDAKIYAKSSDAINQIRASRIFDTEISGVEDQYIFWKISPSFIYAKLQQPKAHGIYKHHNEITDVRLKPVIKVREWPEIEKDFGVNIRTNPVEYAEVLKLRVDNRGEPEVVMEYLRKLNLLTSNFEKYLADAQDILEKAVIEAEEARKEREEFRQLALARARQQKDKIKEAEKSLEIFIKSILEKNSNKPAAVERFKFDKTNSDRTHRDRTVDGARDNWHRICTHCRQPYPFYSSCDCRY